MDSTISILVVEDNTMDQLVIARFLKEKNYLHTIASSVHEALTILKEKKFDVIHSD